MLRILVAAEIRLDTAGPALRDDVARDGLHHVEDREQEVIVQRGIEQRGDVPLWDDHDVRLEQRSRMPERDNVRCFLHGPHSGASAQDLGAVEVVLDRHVAAATAAANRARCACVSAIATASATLSWVIGASSATRCGSMRCTAFLSARPFPVTDIFTS